MKPQFWSRPTLLILPILLAVLLAVCLPGFNKALSSLSSPIVGSNSAYREWSLATDTAVFDSQLLAAFSASHNWTAVDPASFNLPNLPDPCKDVEKLTGQPCKWEVYRSESVKGEEEVRVVLKSGDRVLGQGEALRAKLSSLGDIGSSQAYQGASHGWISRIEVSLWLQRLGVGKVIWIATDVVAKSVSEGYSEKCLRFFSDAVGWGPTLLKSIGQYWEISKDLYVYIVR
jgi:hypothetical protein